MTAHLDAPMEGRLVFVSHSTLTSSPNKNFTTSRIVSSSVFIVSSGLGAVCCWKCLAVSQMLNQTPDVGVKEAFL